MESTLLRAGCRMPCLRCAVARICGYPVGGDVRMVERVQHMEKKVKHWGVEDWVMLILVAVIPLLLTVTACVVWIINVL